VDNFNTLGSLTQRDLPGSRKVVITYDEVLRQWKVTNPHVSTGDSTYGLVETRFDALGRVKTVINQDGNSSAFDYAGNATKVQDESSKQRLLVTDAFGRLTKVCEVTGGNARSPNENCNISGFTASGYPTTFQYNLLDNLTQIQQGPSGQQQTRTFSYDNLGRQTAGRILEVSTGTDVTYAYQDDGDLVTSVTDPRGTVNYEYDSLHRLKKRKHGTTVVAEFTYDGTYQNNAIGRLITEHDGPAGSSNKVDYTYDQVGRVKTANRTVSSTAYNMSYAYDLMGNLDTLDYPSSSGTRRKVQYAYKSGTGELDKVSDITGTAFDYVTGTTYSNLGPLATLSLNNTVSTTLDWNKRGLITGILTQKSGSTTHLDLDYTYYANGQISEIINALNSLKSEKYTYDDLLRLATAQRGPDANIQRKYSYDYDRFGNRWAQTVVAGSGLGGTNTFNYGSNRVTTTGFSYDGSGNLTANGAGSSYTYDQENRMTAAGASVSYSYDAQGRRVQKTVSGTVTDYFYSGAEVIAEKTASSWTDYIFFGAQRIAKQTGSSLSTATFLHTDHLGSVRVATDSSGNSAGSCDYEPFGEMQPGTSCTVPVDFHFAGMAWDSNAGPNGLYHTWFRRYDINQGRWMGVDPLAGSADAPQSFDRFAYVLNAPADLIDPLGLFPCPLAADTGDPVLMRGCDRWGNFTPSGDGFSGVCFLPHNMDPNCRGYTEQDYAHGVLIVWLANVAEEELRNGNWTAEDIKYFVESVYRMGFAQTTTRDPTTGEISIDIMIGPPKARAGFGPNQWTDASVRAPSQFSPFPPRTSPLISVSSPAIGNIRPLTREQLLLLRVLSHGSLRKIRQISLIGIIQT
jgi:RHS repeat-associated protein